MLISLLILIKKECGVINTPPNVRIVGGVEAEAHSWPSMALIRINITEEFYIPEYDFYYQYEGTFSVEVH